jgi:hypothetical protein
MENTRAALVFQSERLRNLQTSMKAHGFLDWVFPLWGSQVWPPKNFTRDLTNSVPCDIITVVKQKELKI